VPKILYGLLFIILLSTPCISYSAYYGPTFSNEHLYRIAMRIRANSHATIPQVMMALLYTNPGAFNHHNINGLKAGYRLQVPEFTMISKVRPEFATKAVMQQNLLWKKRFSSNQVSHQATASNASARKLPVSEGAQLAGNASETQNSILADKVNRLIADNQTYVQQTDAKLAILEQHSQQLATQINQLNTQLKALTYHFILLNAKAKPSAISAVMTNLKANAFTLLAGFASLIALSYFLARSFQKKPEAIAEDQDEYDYMASDESIPSKLDLARVYMDMGDFSAAKNILKDVLLKGNKQQQEGANDLLVKLGA
jgi:FimV-like protein